MSGSAESVELQDFTYHPAPVSTGYVEVSDNVCVARAQTRGFIYVGPVYGTHDLDDALCPWCIADGTAYVRFDAGFVDRAGIGGYGEWDAVADTVVEEVACRTPYFSGWQQERWFTHCGYAAEFVAIVGRREELERFGSEVVAMIPEETGLEGEEPEFWMRALNRDRGPTVYAFRCRICGTFGGYSDTL